MIFKLKFEILFLLTSLFGSCALSSSRLFSFAALFRLRLFYSNCVSIRLRLCFYRGSIRLRLYSIVFLFGSVQNAALFDCGSIRLWLYSALFKLRLCLHRGSVSIAALFGSVSIAAPVFSSVSIAAYFGSVQWLYLSHYLAWEDKECEFQYGTVSFFRSQDVIFQS